MRFSSITAILFCFGNANAFLTAPSVGGRAPSRLSMILDIPPNVPGNLVSTQKITKISSQNYQIDFASNPASTLAQGAMDFLVPPAFAADKVKPPTNDEIKLLREALGAIYGGKIVSTLSLRDEFLEV